VISQYYNPTSIMCDDDTIGIIITMMEGLKQLSFNLRTNDPKLDAPDCWTNTVPVVAVPISQNTSKPNTLSVPNSIDSDSDSDFEPSSKCYF